MSKADESRAFQESLVSAYFEGVIRRAWLALSQIVDAPESQSDDRAWQTLKIAVEQAWVRFINCLRDNPEYRHVLAAALQKAGFEETMPYKKIGNTDEAEH